ncbi:unnamed protein product [Owenia fusiformis]|uniref:Carboxylesterase type B domain-containing protein n=1 Tax=Owenia fusiformis TaxID=6347 RepID=A0A8S4PA82_OWEFU|nr:unnamed protein product [Owenia fusiformis]
MRSNRRAIWSPVVDGEFITEPPVKLDEATGPGYEMLTSVDLMMGINSHEGYMILRTDPRISSGNQSSAVAFVEELMQTTSNYYGGDLSNDMYEAIWYAYFGLKAIDDMSADELFEKVVHLGTDEAFLLPLDHLTHAYGQNCFLYHLTHAPSYKAGTVPSWMTGADHTDDLQYLFYSPILQDLSPLIPKGTELEKNISENMITYWTNFAKTG